MARRRSLAHGDSKTAKPRTCEGNAAAGVIANIALMRRLLYALRRKGALGADDLRSVVNGARTDCGLPANGDDGVAAARMIAALLDPDYKPPRRRPVGRDKAPAK